MNATNPEVIDVDKDLSKCKIVFPLFLGNELHHVLDQASNTCILRASSTILYISHKILISLYRRHELWLSILLSGNDCMQNHKLGEMQLNKFESCGSLPVLSTCSFTLKASEIYVDAVAFASHILLFYQYRLSS